MTDKIGMILTKLHKRWVFFSTPRISSYLYHLQTLGGSLLHPHLWPQSKMKNICSHLTLRIVCLFFMNISFSTDVLPDLAYINYKACVFINIPNFMAAILYFLILTQTFMYLLVNSILTAISFHTIVTNDTETFQRPSRIWKNEDDLIIDNCDFD